VVVGKEEGVGERTAGGVSTKEVIRKWHDRKLSRNAFVSLQSESESLFL